MEHACHTYYLAFLTVPDCAYPVPVPNLSARGALWRLCAVAVLVVVVGGVAEIVTHRPTNQCPAQSFTLPDTLAADPTYMTDLQSVYRVAWASDKNGMFDVGPVAERFHEVIVRGDEVCEVRNWECQGGLVAHMVKWIFGATLNQEVSDVDADRLRFVRMSGRNIHFFRARA